MSEVERCLECDGGLWLRPAGAALNTARLAECGVYMAERVQVQTVDEIERRGHAPTCSMKRTRRS